MTTDNYAELMGKLHSFPMFVRNGALWMMTTSIEPTCLEAADAIEALVKALSKFTSHDECEDCWYSCATLTCDDGRKSEKCDCGAAGAIAALAGKGEGRKS